MTEREYAGLPIEKRKLLFAAKLLPVDDAHRYWKEFLSRTLGEDGGEDTYCEFCEFVKCTFLLEDLRAVVREADKRGWWPGDKQLNEYLRKRPLISWQSRVPDWVVDREKVTIVAAQQLLRAIVLGSVSEVAESLYGGTCARNSFGEAPYIIAASMAIDALADEPQWEQMCQTPEGRHLILGWLQQAIFKGRKVQDALACLRRILGQGCSKSDVLELEQAYCSYCVWIGWREGLEDARLNGSGYAQGCLRLVAGDLAGAYKSQARFKAPSCF